MGTTNQPRTAALLLTLFGVNGLLVLAEYGVLYGYHLSITTVRVPPPDWIGIVRYGVFAGQLFTLSLLGALAQERRWAMWLSLLPFFALLTLAIMPDADRNWLRMLWYILDRFDRHVPYMCAQLSVLFFEHSIVPLCMLMAGILLLSVLCWPLKVYLGWGLAGRGSATADGGRVSTWQLMLWLGLWSVLFFIYTVVREFYGTEWLITAWLALSLVLVVGFPVALWCSGDRIRWYSWLAIPAYVLTLSYAESELSFLVASLNRGQTGIPISYVLCINASLAAVAAENLMVVRAFGIRLVMPLWLPTDIFNKPTSESPATETATIRR